MTIATSASIPRYSNHYGLVTNRDTIAREALNSALKLRRKYEIDLYRPVCAYDLAARMGIEVRFDNVPSMDGMYCKYEDGTRVIVLASERPSGRQHYNCAHEIGHDVFNDGTRIDELIDDPVPSDSKIGTQKISRRPFDPVEFRADRFASFLLMPKSVVDRAFALRNLAPASCSPLDIYRLSGVLGVGYTTLVQHLCYSLRLISKEQAQELAKVRLSKLRTAIAARPTSHTVILDEEWETATVDVHVGDLLLLPTGWSWDDMFLEQDSSLSPEFERRNSLLVATKQGKSTIHRGNQYSIAVRISRRGYVGRNQFRHLDDPDDDE